MRLAWGETRFVILIDKYAVKIARIRFVRPIKQLFLHLKNKEVKKRLEQFDNHPGKAGCKYLFVGILSNRREAATWRDYASDILAPTLWSFLGIINLQLRGDPVEDSDIESHVLNGLLAKFPAENDDTLSREQFSRIDGVVVLHDYGRSEIVPALAAYAQM